MTSLARVGTFLLLGAVMGAGCRAVADRGGDAGGPPNQSLDAGTVPMDAGPADAGPEEAGLPGLTDETDGTDGCSDGLDNDGNGQLDCDDAACRRTPVCCVGSLEATCCSDTAHTVLARFRGCDNGPLAECTLPDGVEGFGATPPQITDGTLVPLGTPAYAGVRLGGAVDVRRSRIAFEARIHLPPDRCTDCIDATGLALVAPEDFTGALNYLRLAILVVGATNETVLILNGEVVDRTPLPDRSELGSDRTVSFGSDDTGGLTYSLGNGERTLPARSLPNLPGALVPTVLGQNENASEQGAISVVRAQFDRWACDIPDATTYRGEPVFPASVSSFEPGLSLGRASVVQLEAGPRWMVVEIDGSLHALQANGNGEFVPAGGAADPGTVVVAGTPERRASAPWLESTEGGFHLYWVETRVADGSTQLLRAFFTSLAADDGAPPTTVLDAQALGVRRIGAASHLGEQLVVEIEDERGTHLWQFGTDGGAWSETGRAALPAVDDVFAFDRDHVGEPALVRDGEFIRLYYTGRRGTRRSVGLLVSTQGTAWREMGEVLLPSAQGFDSLQVGSPAPVVGADGVDLYYLARSGDQRRIGVAHH